MLHELSFLKSYSGSADDLALGLVVKTWGSAPRRAGSIMLLSRDGCHVGSLSGGCVEGAVITEADSLTAAPSGTVTPRTLTFDVATDDAWSVGLACGGEIMIHLQVVGAANLAVLLAAHQHLESRQAFVLVIDRKTGALSLAGSDNSSDRDKLDTRVEATAGQIAVLVPPPPRLLVTGAVHISEHLADFATALAMPVDIIEPRPVFLAARPFAGTAMIAVHNLWPDELPEALKADRMTAVVALSHDPKIDDPLLIQALQSDCFYIAALGSRKSHKKRLTRLQATGVKPTGFDRIRGPAGLAIGAANPAEIALSIMAEIVATHRLPTHHLPRA